MHRDMYPRDTYDIPPCAKDWCVFLPIRVMPFQWISVVVVEVIKAMLRAMRTLDSGSSRRCTANKVKTFYESDFHTMQGFSIGITAVTCANTGCFPDTTAWLMGNKVMTSHDLCAKLLLASIPETFTHLKGSIKIVKEIIKRDVITRSQSEARDLVIELYKVFRYMQWETPEKPAIDILLLLLYICKHYDVKELVPEILAEYVIRTQSVAGLYEIADVRTGVHYLSRNELKQQRRVLEFVLENCQDVRFTLTVKTSESTTNVIVALVDLATPVASQPLLQVPLNWLIQGRRAVPMFLEHGASPLYPDDLSAATATNSLPQPVTDCLSTPLECLLAWIEHKVSSINVKKVRISENHVLIKIKCNAEIFRPQLKLSNQKPVFKIFNLLHYTTHVSTIVIKLPMVLREQTIIDVEHLLNHDLVPVYGCVVTSHCYDSKDRFAVELTLRHSLTCLCRHAVRRALKRSSQLTHGIQKLDIPAKFKLYLNFEDE